MISLLCSEVKLLCKGTPGTGASACYRLYMVLNILFPVSVLKILSRPDSRACKGIPSSSALTMKRCSFTWMSTSPTNTQVLRRLAVCVNVAAVYWRPSHICAWLTTSFRLLISIRASFTMRQALCRPQTWPRTAVTSELRRSTGPMIQRKALNTY